MPEEAGSIRNRPDSPPLLLINGSPVNTPLCAQLLAGNNLPAS